MSDEDGPDPARHDDPRHDPEGVPIDGARPDGQDGATGKDRVRPARRAQRTPWWRLSAAAAAVGALTWGVTASDAALWLDGDARADGAGATAGPGAGAYVDTAVLACPGPVPWLGDASQDRPRVEVLAAGLAQSVLDAVPPLTSDDSTATAAPDGSSPTTAPDAASATDAPDAAGATASPEAADATATPDGSTATSAPDAAAVTGAGPDEAASTQGPDAAGASAAPVRTQPEARSVLRTTDEDGPSAELERGTPAGFLLEQAEAAVVDAADGTAPGVTGGQLGLGTQAGSRGLTLSGCVTAGETQWLVGGGSAAGRSEQLVLTNPGPDAITVAVSVWGADGPVELTGGSGIVVPGGGRVVELLDGLAPAADAPVVAVAATGGPVVAHLAESFREGTTDRGTEVVSPVAAPATDLVVPALPAAPEGHERQVVLRIAAPGEAEAVVDLTALTAQGAVRLTDRVTRVPAGHTVDVELDGLPEGATALRLRSDEPVTAGARLEVLPAEGEPEVVEEAAADDSAAEDPDTGATAQGEPLLRAAGDLAWVGATVPVATPTGLALPGRGRLPGAAAALALSAVDGTTAWVTWVDEDGQETSRSVDLLHDTTVMVALPEEARAVWVAGTGTAGVASAVHVTGGDDRGPFVAATTVPELPWLRQVTQVRPVVP